MLKKKSEIEKLRKQFWLYFKSRKSKPSGISMDELYEYFKKLSNDITVLANDEADPFCSSHDFSGHDATFPE